VEPDFLTQERVARNDALFRESNEKIADVAESIETDLPRVPFICECADRACTQIVRMTLEEYEEVRSDPRTFVNVPGHQVAAQGAGVVVEERERYNIVRKIGHAGDVVERLDERSTSAEEAAS